MSASKKTLRRPALWTALGFGIGIFLGRTVEIGLAAAAGPERVGPRRRDHRLLSQGALDGLDGVGGRRPARCAALPHRHSPVPFAAPSRARGLWPARRGHRAHRPRTRAQRRASTLCHRVGTGSHRQRHLSLERASASHSKRRVLASRLRRPRVPAREAATAPCSAESWCLRLPSLFGSARHLRHALRRQIRAGCFRGALARTLAVRGRGADPQTRRAPEY